MSSAVDPTKSKGFFGHPTGLATLFAAEMWERFSYYGIRPLLTLFMAAAVINGGFGFERSQATAIVGIYGASVYLSSLPGGWIADRLLGLRKAILYGAVLISLGHISIGLSAFAGGKVAFFVGLILIVLGTGLLKPNISAIVGDLYPEGGSRRDAGFSIFYMGINLGAFLGFLVAGYLGEEIGWHWGFGAAGVGMIFGLITYMVFAPSTLGDIGMEPTKHPDPAIQKAQETRVKLITSVGLTIIAAVVVIGAMGLIPLDAQVIGSYMTYVLLAIAVGYFAYLFIFGNLTGDEMKRVGVIAILFVAAAIFWSAFEQAPTSLNLFAKDFTERTIFGWEVPASWFQSFNSMFIILLAPVFAVIWQWLGKREKDPSSPLKFAFGLFFAGIGFFLMIFAANYVVAGGGAIKVAAYWLIFSYLFQSIGELCLSPVGLSSMTKLSPRRYVGKGLDDVEIGVSPRDQSLKTANRLRPFQRINIVLDTQHRRCVDGRALKDALDQLAAFGQAEDFRQRPWRLVGLQAFNGARRQDQHAMTALPAQHLLPGEGCDIELGKIEPLGEGRRRRVAQGQPLAAGGNEAAIGHAHARGRAVPGEHHIAIKIDSAKICNCAIRRIEHTRIVQLELLDHIGHPARAERLPGQHVDAPCAQNRPHGHFHRTRVGCRHDPDAVIIGYAKHGASQINGALEPGFADFGSVRAAQAIHRKRADRPAGAFDART